MKIVATLALAAALAAGMSACGEEALPSPPGADSADAKRAADLLAVQTEVGTVAPALESFYRGKAYPTTLTGAQASLEDAGIELMPRHEIAGYAYDDATTEFTLCIESEAGAWATYDTAPMSLREGAETGGCPDDLG